MRDSDLGVILTAGGTPALLSVTWLAGGRDAHGGERKTEVEERGWETGSGRETQAQSISHALLGATQFQHESVTRGRPISGMRRRFF